MVNSRMATSWLSSTLCTAVRLQGATGLGGLKDSLAAAAADFGPYGLGAGLAGTAMAKLLAEMRSTLERPATGLHAYVLGFDWQRVDTHALLLLLGDPQLGLLLARTAVLATAVTSTVSSRLADLEA